MGSRKRDVEGAVPYRYPKKIHSLGGKYLPPIKSF